MAGVVRLRVHFAPIGWEVERLVSPAVEMRADFVYLLIASTTDRTAKSLKACRDILKNKRIKSKVLEVDLWDAGMVVNSVAKIVNSAPGHDYFFNLSTGPKPASLGGLICGMFWEIAPYYVPADYTQDVARWQGDYRALGSAKQMVRFRIPPLDRDSVLLLSYIATEARPVAKLFLLGKLREAGVIGPRAKTEVTEQAFYGQLNALLERLSAMKLIVVEGKGRRARIALTAEGRDGYKMFHHVLFPSPPPVELLQPS